MQPVSSSPCCAQRSGTRPVCTSSGPKPANRASRLLRSALRLPTPPPAATERPSKTEPSEGVSTAAPASSTPSRKGLVSQSLDELGTLANNLLMNAASWRVVRGQTYCLHCHGTGRAVCGACQGSGIVQPEKVRMNTVRHAAGKLTVLLGMNDAKMFDSDWMKSNRCKRCHGSGAVECKYCEGTGMLGPGRGAAP